MTTAAHRPSVRRWTSGEPDTIDTIAAALHTARQHERHVRAAAALGQEGAAAVIAAEFATETTLRRLEAAQAEEDTP